ncbi:polyketide synthase, partial [Candidatus Binatia bacterium]|nr:polyketide synthase [Candidatus Binatia bacterium]
MSDVQHDEAALSPTKRTLLAVRTLRAKLERLEADAREPIAVVGMSCRFPGGANGTDAFWTLLASGVDAISRVPADRAHAIAPSVRELLGWGGFVGDVDGFDHRFFGIDRHEADWMDPQARLFLEVAWEALEDAGIPPDLVRGSRSGVFLGAATHDYACLQTAQSSPDELDLAYPLGASHAAIAGRTAYLLDLRGPAIVFDTACSSALVAVHQASRSLRSREVDLAIVGGVNAILSPEVTVAMRNAGWLSRDGRCRPFDVAADGFTRGEGCGVVILKRMSEALADGDAPRASIRGSAVNHNGRSAGLVAPSARAQREAIEQALQEAGIAPADVGYVEAHGSSTKLGDPIELDALRAVFGEPRSDGSRCAVGSVKGNLGHLEAASGIAALIKTVLVLEHALIPPQVHFHSLTPHGTMAGTPLFVARTRERWAGGDRPRRAGVSTFSFTGTNAHAILEQAPAPHARPADGAERHPAALHVLPLSARDDDALRALAGATAELLRVGDHAVADICFSASVRRAHHAERVAVVGRDGAELADRLAAFAQRRSSEAIRVGHVPPGRRARTLFLFP